MLPGQVAETRLVCCLVSRDTLCRTGFPKIHHCALSGGLDLAFSFHALGDSHAKYFFPDDRSNGQLRMGFDPDNLKITGSPIKAASIMGFRPRQSQLNTKVVVSEAASQNDFLVLNFGQVDLELGYYYRRVVKGEETLETFEFSEILIKVYADFLKSISKGRAKIILKGVNLTTLGDPKFSFRYARRIVLNNPEADSKETRQILRSVLKSEDEQNAFHLAFNQGVKDLAAREGYGYFDVIAQTSVIGEDGVVRLDPRFAPARFDHHMANSLALQRDHILGVLRAAGVAPETIAADARVAV